MSYDLKILLKDFENDIWLYLEKSLPDDKIRFWDEQIKSHPELKKIIEETEQVLSVYNENALIDIEEPVFNSVLNSIKDKSSISKKIRELLKINGRTGDGFNTVKIAFGGTLAVAAVVMLLITEKPNPIKNFSSELLDWNAEEIDTQMDEMELSLRLAKDDEFKKYFINKLMEDRWNRDIIIINNGIKEIEKEIKEKSM